MRGAVIAGTGFSVWLVGSLIWVYVIYPRLQLSCDRGDRASGLKWLDYVMGAIGLVIGIALFVPGCFLLLSPWFGFYTVGLTPHWLRYALYGLSVLVLIHSWRDQLDPVGWAEGIGSAENASRRS